MDADADALDAMQAGIAEANRRARGEFNGLLGSLPTGASVLLSDILDDLRWVVLERYSDEEALALLEERRLALNSDGLSDYRNCTVIPEEVELALRLLNLIGSATKCEGDRFLKFVLGPAGLRDTKRQAGTAEGGKATGRLRADRAVEVHEKWIAKAKSMIANGSEPRSVSSTIAERFGVTPVAVRGVLQGAGVLPKKKKRKVS